MTSSAATKTRFQLVTQAGSPEHRTIGDLPAATPPVALHFPTDAADRLARTPVVHDLLHRDFTVPGAPTLEDRLFDCRRAIDFVAACCRDRRSFASREQAAQAVLAQHRSVAASLALAHAVVDLLEPASPDQQSS
jgi:hypothetical protein